MRRDAQEVPSFRSDSERTTLGEPNKRLATKQSAQSAGANRGLIARHIRIAGFCEHLSKRKLNPLFTLYLFQ
jgi:hypothetical protein